MNLSRPEREQVRQIVQRALDSQSAVNDAQKAVDDARLKLDAANREHTEAMKAFRDWTTSCPYLPIVNGAVAVIVDGQIRNRPIQSVDEVAPVVVVPSPSPAIEPQPSKSAKPARRER